MIYASGGFSTSILAYRRSYIEGSLEVKLPTIWTDEKQKRQREEKA